MKRIVFALMVLVSTSGFAQEQKTIITDDIANFWKAYDQIIQTKDSLKQIELINTLYIHKGTPGLEAIMQARRYTPASYVYAINQYPQFWNSVRANTLKADIYAEEIGKGITQLQKIYPDLKPAKIYFTIGVLRTGGTTMEDKVLIGSEVAMTNSDIITTEIESQYPHLSGYFKTNPINNLTFLNTHEYVHTQQNTTVGLSVLVQAMIEGVAEFLASKALNVVSPNPQIEFGRKNEERIKAAFVKEMFSSYQGGWFWSNPNNEFGMGDLGYFVGYAICEQYYNLSPDKSLAIKEMIQLDYKNKAELTRFVEKSNYFEKPLAIYQEAYENTRPQIIRIEQFDNGSQNVNPNLKMITLHFSKPMNIDTRGFDFGPLGEGNVLMVQRVIGFSEDKRSFSYEIELKPNRRYQSLISERFRDEERLPLKPYLIDIKTSEQ